MGVRLPVHVSPGYSDQSLPSDRHFVIWTDKEDRVLRDQVRLLGTDKWPMIAAHLANKTGRQCRRRWQLCLNVPSKKGGWTLEEDRVLFEAHQKHGNRWTEIAKVLPGRTDNAVKNRFTSLIRKHAKESECSQTESSGDVGSDHNKPVHKRRGSDNFSDSNVSNYSHGSSKKARADGNIQALTPDSVLEQNWRGFMPGPFASPLSEDRVTSSGVNHGTKHCEESRNASLFFEQQPNSRLCASPFGKSWKQEWLMATRNHCLGEINSFVNSFSDGVVDEPPHGPQENDIIKNSSGPNFHERLPSAPGSSTGTMGSSGILPDPYACQRSSFLRTWDQLAIAEGQHAFYEHTGLATGFEVKQEAESTFVDATVGYNVKNEMEEPCVQQQTRDSLQADDPTEIKSDMNVQSPPHTIQQSMHTPLSLTPSSRHLMDGMPSPQFSDMERQFLLSALESCQLSLCESPLKSQVDSPCRSIQTLTNKKIRGPLLDASYDTPCRSPLSSYLLQSYQESQVTEAAVSKQL